ncbi:hypothetical protein EVAR_21088_1 [Eumeta japonica]|uniref:Uncharacterized protein n=1 Tax=Eumeta variegata TaxID=151549 RepID=A0A4C1V1U1_EUMVA|nr:hypothetical protein EVAR_21088_1 [Eumeta japonica]
MQKITKNKNFRLSHQNDVRRGDVRRGDVRLGRGSGDVPTAPSPSAGPAATRVGDSHGFMTHPATVVAAVYPTARCEGEQCLPISLDEEMQRSLLSRSHKVIAIEMRKKMENHHFQCPAMKSECGRDRAGRAWPRGRVQSEGSGFDF